MINSEPLLSSNPMNISEPKRRSQPFPNSKPMNVVAFKMKTLSPDLSGERDYTQYKWIAPPRAETAIPPNLLGFYEKKGWLAQIKKNGTNNVIFIGPDQIIAKTRHNDDHKQWKFTPESIGIFQRLQKDHSWLVLNAELLHSKTPNIKDTNYIHDILVCNSVKLARETYRARYNILAKILSKFIVGETDHYYTLNDKTFLAKNFLKGFKPLFNTLENPEDEGLVLKNPNGLISDKVWTVKCRKQHKNYSF
jgi:hypothetical protein